MAPTRLRAILFDAGNTLIRMNYPVIAETLSRHGARVTPDAIERAERRARVRLDVDVLARFVPGGPAASTENRSVASRYFHYILDELAIPDDATREALIAWRQTYNPPVGLWNALEPTGADALQLTREAGLRAVVVSNSNGTVRSILTDLGLAQWLDDVIDSHEVGVEKPHPEIFRIALARSGLDAADAVYIGDLYSVDVLGARGAGMEAVLLDPAGCWGARDCLVAPDTVAAVRVALERGAAR